MLQLLRKKSQSTFIQIIVVVIALVFIFWGVGTNMMGSRDAALVVNGEEISFQQYQRAYDRAYQRLSDQLGGNVPKGFAETFNIKQQVINQLIQATLLRQGATEMGIVVSAEEIQKTIQAMVQFQENGTFSMERYKSILASNRMAPTKFENSLRFDRLTEIAARDIGNFATVATDYEVMAVYNQINEKISLNFVKVSPKDFLEKVEINDELLKTWFETVKDNYKTEPRLKLKYLTFTFDAISKKIEIDEAKIEEYYKENLSDFQVPEKRHARHILLKAGDKDSKQVHEEKKRKAEEVLQLAKNGGDFADLARKYSEGPSKESGGDLGFFPTGSMVPPFDAAVSALQPGEISNVVKTRFGYHIIFLEEIKPAETPPLSKVKERITQILQRKQAENLTFQVANSAYEGIISAGSFASYAEKNKDAQILETGFVARSDAPEILRQDPLFLDKAFSLNKGELSSLIKGQSGYAIFLAEDLKEPVIPPFDTIKSKLTDDFKKAESEKLAESSAKEILDAVAGGKDLEAVAQEKGVALQTSGLLGQKESAQKSSFPASLVKDAFQLSPSSPLPKKPGQFGDDFYVYTLLSRKNPAPPEDLTELDRYRKDLLSYKRQQILSAWLRNAEMHAEISQHPSL